MNNFIDFGHALGRSEMKKLMAGSGDFCGNIYCTAGGHQYFCAAGDCEHPDANDLIGDLCLSGCINMGNCGGCAQFQVN